MRRKKTLEARKLTGEPSGTLIDSVTIDKVYLWEIENLQKALLSVAPSQPDAESSHAQRQPALLLIAAHYVCIYGFSG